MNLCLRSICRRLRKRKKIMTRQHTQGGFFKIPEDQVTLSEGVLEQNPGWGDGTNFAKGDLPYFKK